MTKLTKLFIEKKRKISVKSDLGPKLILDYLQIYHTLLTKKNASISRP